MDAGTIVFLGILLYCLWDAVGLDWWPVAAALGAGWLTNLVVAIWQERLVDVDDEEETP